MRCMVVGDNQRDSDHVIIYALKPDADETINNLLSDIYVSMKTEDFMELIEGTG